jgi:hypothetical protein
LIERIVASGAGLMVAEYEPVYYPGDDLFAICRARGLPIGNLTSQFWANVYLNELDQFVKRQLGCQGYLRYVDDLLLFADDSRQLIRWRAAVIEKLAELRLALHEQRAQARPVTEGVPYLGFVVYPDHRRLKAAKVVAWRRRFASLRRVYGAGMLDLAQMNASVLGWVNHARYGDTLGLRRAILAAAPIRPLLVNRAA